MLKERLSAVAAVKAEFLSAELAQDEAAISAARCVATMLEVRRGTRLPLGTGLDAITQMSRAAALSIEARACIINAHPMLAELPRDLGVSAYGDGDCPPVDRPVGLASVSLRSVA